MIHAREESTAFRNHHDLYIYKHIERVTIPFEELGTREFRLPRLYITGDLLANETRFDEGTL